MILVDADACPVKAEIEAVATRSGTHVKMVSNGGIRPSQNPLVENVYVDQGADAADIWIAENAGPGDVVVTNDMPLAARAVEAGAEVIKPNGDILTATNIGQALAMRDLMTDLRAADPFRQGGGRPFSKSDRARFRDGLDRVLRRAAQSASRSD